MKAIAAYPGAREVRRMSRPEPAIVAPTEVRMRVREVGICGTDREIVSFQYGTPPPGSDYLVLGHESLAEVVEVGAAVTRVVPGDLVVTMVRRPCPHPDCMACVAGRPDFCYSGDFTERGIKGAHGFMAEFVVDQEEYLNRVPPDIREVAVLVEPLTIAEKAMQQVWHIQERLPWVKPGRTLGEPTGRRAVVLGAGPVGLLGAMVLRAEGFQTIVYSRSPGAFHKDELVRSFGAEYIAAETHSMAQLLEAVGEVDLVYEATGASKFSFEMLSYLGDNGVFVFTGVPGRRAPVELDTDLLMRNLVLKNQIVFGTVNASREAYEAAIHHLAVFLARWPDALRGIISQRFPMDAFEEPLLGEPKGIKNVIVVE